MLGIITKGIGGFYYIRTEEGIVECKARGKFRLDELTPTVGDKVEITVKNNKGVIEKVFERTNKLIRPAVSNVTQAFVVFTLVNPDLNIDLLNSFLLLCEFNKIRAVVCINKIDLVTDTGRLVDITGMLTKAGYEVLHLNAKEGMGIDDLREKLANNITVFSGPSGVGKSTILNKVTREEKMKTGDLSEKLGRGKHTTRHSELIEINSGFVVDTPGFSSLNLSFIDKEELQYLFPEFSDSIGNCKFTGCLHYKEPGCEVKSKVTEGEVSRVRYEFYIKVLEELMKGRTKR